MTDRLAAHPRGATGALRTKRRGWPGQASLDPRITAGQPPAAATASMLSARMSSAWSRSGAGDDQRRRQGQHVAHGRLEGEAARERSVQHASRRLVGGAAVAVADQLDADQQAGAAHVADQRRGATSISAAAPARARPTLGARSTSPSLLDDLERGQRRARPAPGSSRGCSGRAPVRSATSRSARAMHGGDRQDAAAQRLAQHQDVGRDAGVFGRRTSGRSCRARSGSRRRSAACRGGRRLRAPPPEARRRQVGHGARSARPRLRRRRLRGRACSASIAAQAIRQRSSVRLAARLREAVGAAEAGERRRRARRPAAAGRCRPSGTAPRRRRWRRRSRRRGRRPRTTAS